MEIAKNMKKWREEHNLTQCKLSSLTGISQVNLHYYENNKRIPSIENCAILADFYGISIDELVGHEIKKNW